MTTMGRNRQLTVGVSLNQTFTVAPEYLVATIAVDMRP